MRYRTEIKTNSYDAEYVHIDVIDGWSSYSIEMSIGFIGRNIPEESKEKAFAALVEHMLKFSSEEQDPINDIIETGKKLLHDYLRGSTLRSGK